MSLISTPLALPRQRLASEAAKSEAGDVGHLRTVGRPEEDPFLVVRLTDARTWWRAAAYRVGNVRTLGSHSATPSGATPRYFCATTTTPRNKTLRCVSSFNAADASTSAQMCCSASLERFSVDVNRNSKGVPKSAQIRFGLL